jgi:hypothetical protein
MFELEVYTMKVAKIAAMSINCGSGRITLIPQVEAGAVTLAETERII